MDCEYDCECERRLSPGNRPKCGGLRTTLSAITLRGNKATSTIAQAREYRESAPNVENRAIFGWTHYKKVSRYKQQFGRQQTCLPKGVKSQPPRLISQAPARCSDFRGLQRQFLTLASTGRDLANIWLIIRVRNSNLGLSFLAFKCCVSQLSVDQMRRNLVNFLLDPT